MPFIPVENTISCFLQHTGPNGNIMGNRIWITDDTGQPDLTRLEQLWNILRTWWAADMSVNVSNQVALTGIELRDFTEQNGPVYDESVIPAVLGTNTSPVLPANVTFVTGFRTGIAGRSFRGRAYHVGLAEGSVTGDFVSTARANSILNVWESLQTTRLEPVNFSHVVVSLYANGAPRTAGVKSKVIQYKQVDLRVDTQRRRLIGEGD